MTMHTRSFTIAMIMLAMIGLARAEPQSQTFRNDLGQQLGRADRHGNTTIFRNERGQETGRAEFRPDGTTIYFNERGQRTGSSSPSSSPRPSR
jgi:hypothetical protein